MAAPPTTWKSRPWLASPRQLQPEGSQLRRRWLTLKTEPCSRARRRRPPASAAAGGAGAASHPELAVWSSEAATRTLGWSLAGLALVAVDVFSPGSIHLLQPLDAAAHSWVGAHVPEQLSRIGAGKVLSDAAIAAGLLGWAAAAAEAGGGARSRFGSESGGSSTAGPAAGAALPTALILAAAAYGLGGAFKHGDPLLVAALKPAFGRLRPNPWRASTQAFPSGHTTAAVIIIGELLLLLLPVALAQQRRLQQQQQAQQEGEDTAVADLHPAAASGQSSARRGDSTAQQPRPLPAPAWPIPALSAAVAALARSSISASTNSASSSSRMADSTAVPAVGPRASGWPEALLRHRSMLWAGSAVLTASGRVLADAHWFSDTLAGGCLGAAVVSATVLAWHALDGSGTASEERWHFQNGG